MPTQFHVPINLKKAYGQRYFEAELDLEIEDDQRNFVLLDTVLFDTGGGFTSIPLDWAQAHHIRFSRKKNVPVTGTTGKATAYLDEANIAFADAPNLQFRVYCLFNPQLSRPSCRSLMSSETFILKPPRLRLGIPTAVFCFA